MEDNLAMADRIIGDPLLGPNPHSGDTAGAGSVDIDSLYREQRVRLTRPATAITLDRHRAETAKPWSSRTGSRKMGMRAQHDGRLLDGFV